MSQPARVLEAADVRRVLRRVGCHRHAARDKIIVLLSFKAGLRACEIAGLTWPMVLRPDGRLSHLIYVSGTIAKNGSARRIPVHPELKTALVRMRAEHGNAARQSG